MEKAKPFEGAPSRATGKVETPPGQIEAAEVGCPDCGRENEKEASFCAHCGAALLPARQCPVCRAPVLPGADICEACGAWLLEGQCKFCYAPLEEGAKFCTECGNPVEGIPCPQCGKLSSFDFCKHCGIPLTPQAYQAIEELKKTLGADLKGPIEQTSVPPMPSKEKVELAKMREYQKRVQKGHEENISHKPLFQHGQIDELVRQAEEAQSRPATLLQPDTLQKVQQRTFKNNQEARRFFGALKVILPKVTRKPLGWRCNAYNCLHPEGPQGCANPAPGGEWIFETTTTLEEVQI